MESTEAFAKKIESKLYEWNEEIEKLEKNARQQKALLPDELNKAKTKATQLEKRLHELRNSGKDASVEIRSTINEAAEFITVALDQAFKKINL
jgi:predicted nuclease with TOPRIM domain